MKKQLLLGSALLAVITAFPQNGRTKPQPSGVVKWSDDNLKRGAVENNASTTPIGAANKNIIETPEIAAGTLSTSANWQKIGGSGNIYGVLVSSSKPLQYNSSLNAVSFIHRKSSTYTAQPVSNSGAIVAEISTNWGATWDSTCVWSNGTQLARYPQGGIFNPPGNTNISNAYVVVSGPATSGSGWVGSYYASKQLGAGNYNNTASAATGAQQFFPNSAPTGTVLGHDHGRYSFTSTQDGKVRSMAELTNDPSGGGTILPGDTAALLMTGSFNAGTFIWAADKFQPNFVKASDGSPQCTGQPYMAWNSVGDVGYVVLIGALNSATLSNRGFQPIVYKTTNYGASWAQIQGIDFNSAAMAPIKAPIAATNTQTNLEVPFFHGTEGIDVIVDANNKLHIVSTIIGTSSVNNDSLGFVYSFTNADGEKYRWPHTPGAQPYIYDFIGDGTAAWTYKTIDSLSSEVPSSSSTGAGYNDNPWDADAANSGAKVSSSARIQLSRTPNGDNIIYTFAESDTNFTTSAHKWNSLPNVKARCMKIGSTPIGYTISPTEINVTKPAAGNGTVNPNVNGRAMFHYVSPTAGMPLCGPSTTINLPMTVTNSNPYSQLTNNTHWYSTAKLDFSGIICFIGMNEESAAANLANVSLYPNPAMNNAVLTLELKESTPVMVSVYNTVGQLVKTTSASGTIGENRVNLNIEGLSSGIYMVKVKAGGLTSTKKLIIE
ncbi:MAG: T9SS type A sorting domain-containing protein [Bacteroidetes bacterium]|nr:T9SS type A sorting domain-containing protein [Bacteroidota bacterium]